MNLITVEVLCPSTSRSYDYRLPRKMRIGAVKKKMIGDIRIFEGLPALFEREDTIMLYYKEKRLNENATPEQYQIENGDRLMLI